MNFQQLPTVEKYEFYLDVAIKRGKAKASQQPKYREEPLARYRRKTNIFVRTTAEVLQGKFMHIIKSYPPFAQLPQFYKELARVTLDVADVRQSLGALQWATEAIQQFAQKYQGKIRGSRSIEDIKTHQRAYVGRISSVVKQVKKNFVIIEQARKIMKQYPDIKELATIVIAGYPNVGKTTLLKALTDASPKIASYPFTTLKPMLGTYVYKNNTYQVMDTPGMLDRPLSEMNPIEKQAVLALKHLAEVVVYILDPTEECGYSLLQQQSLLKQLQRQFSAPFIVVSNKSDKENHVVVKNVLNISAKEERGITTLRQQVDQHHQPQ